MPNAPACSAWAGGRPAASARLDRELAAMASVLEAPRRSLWVSAVQGGSPTFPPADGAAAAGGARGDG
ncbi:MAG: hypothetical protein ACLTG4_03025 [Oscillospiraceae bacterium]